LTRISRVNRHKNGLVATTTRTTGLCDDHRFLVDELFDPEVS